MAIFTTNERTEDRPMNAKKPKSVGTMTEKELKKLLAEVASDPTEFRLAQAIRDELDERDLAAMVREICN
jgi:hypothetical protein